MATPLKLFFDEALARSLEADLARAGLPTDGFVAEATAGLDALELTARAQHVARALRSRLPADVDGALRAIVTLLGPPHATDELLGAGMAPFRYLPHSNLIGLLGPQSPAVGLWACRELTTRFTAEFCLRPILLAAPDATWAALRAWVADPDPHVRRLVSEGTRPRLPWATRLRALQEDPSPVLPLLLALADDPAPLVRRSVANHLGDVAKDHPELAVATAEAWLRARPSRRPLVAHALRHLGKQGHPGALGLLGQVGAEVRVEGFRAPLEVPLGETVGWSATLVSTGSTPQDLRVDAVVTFQKARGTSEKVFRVAAVTLAPGASAEVSGKVRTHAMTTRSHHRGTHRVDLQVNGTRLVGGAFEVV